MQGFRIYNDPVKMLHLHSGSNEGTECEKEVDAIIENEAS